MKRLHLDIETYSSESINNGVYRYSEADDFDVLLIAHKRDDAPTEIIDLASGEGLPEWLVIALGDPFVVKCAHNAQFERVCLSRYMRRKGFLGDDEWLDPRQWECSMVLCQRCGVPSSLADAGAYLQLTERKMTEGKDLISLFCNPHKSSSSIFEGSVRIKPCDRPEDWGTFKAYCIRDVDVEYGIAHALSWYVTTDFEKHLYAVDQTINDRGVRFCRGLAENAVAIDAVHTANLNAEAIRLTGLPNPNSVNQLKDWIESRTGERPETLRKENLSELRTGGDGVMNRVLQIRSELGRTSVKKYTKMLSTSCSDDRLRGVQCFCGTRTGRWAGRLLQTQNLPKNHVKTLGMARHLLMEGDAEAISLVYGDVPDTLSQLVRTALIPSEGRIFGVCDYSAVEARITAWLAGEGWVLEVFRNGGDIYCETASMMFKVPVKKHGPNSELRQKGKIAVLALGYQGGTGALEAMGATKMGISAKEQYEICCKYRDANPNIVALWGALEKAATETILYGPGAEKTVGRWLKFRMEGTTLTVELPSGRRMCYPRAMVSTRWGKTRIQYWGLAEDKGSDKKSKVWCWVETYGGKLTENIVQAIGRDCLAEAMVRVEDSGIPVVFHVHDELVTELDSEEQLKTLTECFSVTPEWAQGLPLEGAAYTGDFYFKD